MCFGAQKNRLIETVLLSTHNICFDEEMRKMLFNYALLSGGMQYLNITVNKTLTHVIIIDNGQQDRDLICLNHILQIRNRSVLKLSALFVPNDITGRSQTINIDKLVHR